MRHGATGSTRSTSVRGWSGAWWSAAAAGPAVNAMAEKLAKLDRLTWGMAQSSDLSDYHKADEQFHQLVGTASELGAAVAVQNQFSLKNWEVYS